MLEASSGPTSLHRSTRSRSPEPAPTLWEAGQVRTLVGIPVTLALPDLLNIHQGGICGGKEPPQTGLTLPLPRSDAGSWAGWKGPKVALREIPKPAGEMGVQAPHTRAGEWGVWVCRVGLTCRKKTNCASLPSLNPKGKRGGTGSKKSRWGDPLLRDPKRLPLERVAWPQISFQEAAGRPGPTHSSPAGCPNMLSLAVITP